MKLLPCLAFTVGSLVAGDLYQHVQLPLLDAYVDSSVSADPEIPGMGETRYFISVSITSTDQLASIYGVYLRVRMADGADRPVLEFIPRTDSGTAPTVRRFYVGTVKPVKIIAFNVTRFHPENADQLIHPAN
jgi:hypothetical protein